MMAADFKSRDFCTKGHFCARNFLHGGSLMHEGWFLQKSMKKTIKKLKIYMQKKKLKDKL